MTAKQEEAERMLKRIPHGFSKEELFKVFDYIKKEAPELLEEVNND